MLFHVERNGQPLPFIGTVIRARLTKFKFNEITTYTSGRAGWHDVSNIKYP